MTLFVAVLPGIVALAYLAAYGARMPILAMRGLLRLRNLVLIAVPALALGAFALALQGRVDDGVAAGAISVAIVPSPLVGPGIVARLRGRMDLAGALGLGTVIVSLLLVGSRGSLASGALFAALEVYAIAAMVAGALPPVRDALLPVLRVIGWAAFALVLIVTSLNALSFNPQGAAPVLGAENMAVAAALFGLGIAVAFVTAAITSRDPVAAIAGAGLRDPALAAAFAMATTGAAATGVPLIYAVFCLGLTAAALLRR